MAVGGEAKSSARILNTEIFYRTKSSSAGNPPMAAVRMPSDVHGRQNKRGTQKTIRSKHKPAASSASSPDRLDTTAADARISRISIDVLGIIPTAAALFPFGMHNADGKRSPQGGVGLKLDA